MNVVVRRVQRCCVSIRHTRRYTTWSVVNVIHVNYITVVIRWFKVTCAFNIRWWTITSAWTCCVTVISFNVWWTFTVADVNVVRAITWIVLFVIRCWFVYDVSACNVVVSVVSSWTVLAFARTRCWRVYTFWLREIVESFAITWYRGNVCDF